MPFEWSWEHKLLFIKLQVCFSWIWRNKGGKFSTMASRCNYEDIQQKDTQFRFSNLPVWNMHDNVLQNKDVQCSKRLWHFTFAQTIGYFSALLNVIFCPPLLLLFFFAFFFLWKLIRLSPPSIQAATNEWGFQIQTLHSSWCHLFMLINLCDTWVIYLYIDIQIQEKVIWWINNT